MRRGFLSQPRVTSLIARYRSERRRPAGFVLALIAEAILVLVVVKLGSGAFVPVSAPPGMTTISFRAAPKQQAAKPEQEKSKAETPQRETRQPQARPTLTPEQPTPQVAQPRPQPSPPPALMQLSPREMASADITPPSAASAPRRAMMGPPAPPAGGDTRQVGTAPSGEPLYAASWYREPYQDELTGYMSTASGPGWGTIACRTAPDYRVEDCVQVDEYPTGSNIARAVLAAAWQFRVRPPRIGGRDKIGDWVRIRITLAPSGLKAGS